MDPERTQLSVTVDGEERHGEWEPGVGIWVPGPDINVGDRVEIEEESYRVRTMSRLVKESQACTIIKLKRLVEMRHEMAEYTRPTAHTEPPRLSESAV